MSEAAKDRVLILAPRGRNGELIASVLQRAGIAHQPFGTLDQLCQAMVDGGGAIILCEEAIDGRPGLDCLIRTLETQPPWSEIPLLVLTSGGTTTRGSYEIAKGLAPRGNVTLMERPVRILTLLSTVRTALRARARQYELRDLLASEHDARAAAEAANAAKDHFLATLSHELRTPLNPVLMTVSTLAVDPALPKAVRDKIDLIRRNVELESKLIDDLLDLTRITRGLLELHLGTVDVHAILDDAILTCCEAGQNLNKRLETRRELRATDHFVYGDSARLSQVFWNLINNAAKFTGEGGSITVRTADGPDQTLVVSVTDTGIGIEPAAAERIFDAFEQANRGISKRFGGLGLGLAICKKLVDLHGGSISVHSDGPDRGATFTVRLKTTPQPAPQAAEPAAPAPRAERTGPSSILVVEDHPATAEVMQYLLESLNFEVTVAHDVASARKRLDTGRFDLVISDLGLPDGTGLDVITHLRAAHAIPAIAVSGYGMDDDVRKSREAGFNEHLVKPVDFHQLESAIARVLDPGDASVSGAARLPIEARHGHATGSG